MKLLLDSNLPRRLAPRLLDIFPESMHIAFAGMLDAPDWSIWEYAQHNDYCILSADSDFYERAVASGAPPKVIWLRGGANASTEVENLIRRYSARIAEFLEDEQLAVLVLRG